MLIVSGDGTGGFTTIQEAVDHAGRTGETLILVKPGEYHEKLVVAADGLTLRGESPENTVLWNADYARQKSPDGQERGTFLSYTALFCGNSVTVENLAIRNDAGDGREAGQAVAVYAAGDRAVFRNCHFLACQDTLFCGPVLQKTADGALPRVIPVQAAEAGAVPVPACRQYFENCLVRGDVDFIFGPYRCWFEACRLVCRDRGLPVNGYYTAANTPEGEPFGFVFHRCHLSGDGCADGTVYLGRPWRAYARTVFLDCRMDACVAPAGWQDWGDRPVTSRYAEYRSSGEGACPERRHRQALQLDAGQAGGYSIGNVLGSREGWPDARP